MKVKIQRRYREDTELRNVTNAADTSLLLVVARVNILLTFLVFIQFKTYFGVTIRGCTVTVTSECVCLTNLG